MDILSFLSSINKIALVAFLITLGFLIYEIFRLKKTGETPERPTIPKFQEGERVNITPPPQAPKQMPMGSQKNLALILISVVLLAVFGLVAFISFQSPKSPSRQIVRVPTIIQKPSDIVPSPSIFESPTPKAVPTDVPVLTPVLSETPLLVVSSTVVPTTQISLSPTTITELPETGNFTNAIILFSVSAMVIFFSFLF